MKFLLFLLSVPLWAQPVISDLAVNNLTHNGAKITAVSDVPVCFQILYGVATGDYIYSTQSSCGSSLGGEEAVDASLAMGGLAASKTYYWVLVARLTADTDCDADPGDCDITAEQTLTTLAAGVHPVMPTLPTNPWNPSHPDTSSYDIVPMTRSGVNGDCVAAETVNGSNTVDNWTVNAGDSMQTVMTTVLYGTVIEIEAGITCDIPALNSGFSFGYAPQQKGVDPRAANIDDPDHPWIVIRTKENSSGDFPPFGSRTGPNWLSKMATFQSVTQHAGTNCFRADTSVGVVHHWWIENVRCLLSASVYTTTWTPIVSWGDTNNVEVGYLPPKYNVFDRVYLQGDISGTPQHTNHIGIEIFSKNFAMFGNYILDVEWPDPVSPGATKGIYVLEGSIGPLTFDNNFVKSTGLGLYIENTSRQVVPTDVVFKHNLLYNPWSQMQPMAGVTLPNNWDGLVRNYRQPFESKGAYRTLIDGNIIDGAFADQNEGPAILVVAMTSNGTGTTGNQDYTITNNYIRRAANGINCSSARTGDPAPGPPDVMPFQRMLVANNLFASSGRGLYQNGRNLAGIGDYYIQNSGCADMTVRNNTFGWKNQTPTPDIQYSTSILQSGYGPYAAEGFTFVDNILYYNKGNYAGIISGARNSIASHPMVPATYNTPANQTDIAAVANADFGTVTGSAGLTASYTWLRNIVIGGKLSTYGDTTMDALDQAAINDIHDGSPGLYPGTDIWPTGADQAAREVSAGFNPTTYRVTPNASISGYAGANIDQIYSAAGIVQNIVVMPTEAGARFSYLAPDSRTCAVDTSPNGTTWTRTTDAGGSRYRNTIVGSLSASTSYSWRLICYFDQLNTYDLWTASQLTTGTFTTTSAGTRVISVGFSLPSGATKVVVTAIPAGGATVTATCTTSPCELTLGKRGAYTLRKSYQNNSDVVLALSEIQNMETP